MFCHIDQARWVGEYRISLRFNDGSEGVADLAGELEGPVFEPLRDPALFAGLALSPLTHTICWPNGADLAPEFLYQLALGKAWSPDWRGAVAEAAPTFDPRS